MKIPQSFKDRVAETFYDKTIVLYNTVVVTESDGFTREALEESGSIECNVRFDQLAQIQEEYGFRDQVDVVITCLPEETVEIGAIAEYQDRYFKLFDVRPFDSHKLIVGKQWSLRSSDLVS